MLLDDKSYENVLVYKILHKNFFDPKPLRIRLDKVDGTIKTYDWIRCLELSNTYNKQIFHAFLFNIRNYSPAVIMFNDVKGSWILYYRRWIILIWNKKRHRIFVLLYATTTKQDVER